MTLPPSEELRGSVKNAPARMSNLERSIVSIDDIRAELNLLDVEQSLPWWEDIEEYNSGWSDQRDRLLRAVQSLKKPYDMIVAPDMQPKDGDFVVYWHYARVPDTYDDPQYRVLYVGSSRAVNSRQKAHRKSSRWWNEIDFMEFNCFHSQLEMEARERAFIRLDLPEYNIRDNPRRIGGVRFRGELIPVSSYAERGRYVEACIELWREESGRGPDDVFRHGECT